MYRARAQTLNVLIAFDNILATNRKNNVSRIRSTHAHFFNFLLVFSKTTVGQIITFNALKCH